MSFNNFGLSPELTGALNTMNFQEPTPVQKSAIPAILKRKDLIACAQTGTGKTAAYLIPVIEILSKEKSEFTGCLILAPTRELAKQIDDQANGLGYFADVSSLAVYGGNKSDAWDVQKKALESGCEIIISTPGRIKSHLVMGNADFSKIKLFILDEADKMLDMGFYEDIMSIVKSLPEQKQVLLFSATMPSRIRTLASRILKDPVEISFAVSKPAEGIDQQAYFVFDQQKLNLTESILKKEAVESMLLFTSKKMNVSPLVRNISKLGFNVGGISSDKTQEEREETLRNFKNGNINILVATDILSRGIDVEGVSHVVNYDVPHDAEDYIHRIGRTARAKATGTAITFVNEKELASFRKIENFLERKIDFKENPTEIGMGPDQNSHNGSLTKKVFFKKKFNSKRHGRPASSPQ